MAVRAPAPPGLPNALSLGGLALGFMAALAAGRGDVDQGLRTLALAGMADALAGRAARGLGQGSPLGAELDSLVGLVVWGIAAGLLAYAQGLALLGPLGLAAAGLVVLAAAWRLCRGDLQKGRPLYEGLPPQAGGLVLVSAAAAGVPPWGLAALVPVLLALQLGPLRYPRFNPHLLWLAPVFASLALAALGWRPGWILPGLAALAYAAAAPLVLGRAPGSPGRA